MTDNEIIKALEVCVGMHNDCENCPLLEYSQATDECMTEAMSNALDLINRQQAEIERLQKYNTDVAFKHYNDGIKEFAERLKGNADVLLVGKNGNYYSVSDKDIDNLVKEMVGDTE